MCPRREFGGPLLKGMELTEVSLDTFKIWFDASFIKQLNNFMMCGNLGDPIIAKDTLEIFQYLREINPDIKLKMHTNGSARNKQWWIELAKAGVEVTFGIDGLADTHSLYRIDTDWNKIIENASAFIEAGGIAYWHMLVFEHNETQVDECEMLSRSLGFKDFRTKHTSRFFDNEFPVLDESRNLLYTLKPTSTSKDLSKKVAEAKKEVKPFISCKAQQYSEIYVAADGTVTPCCWLDFKTHSPNNESRADYKLKIGQSPNLNSNTLDEIFNAGYFSKIEGCWNSSGIKECSKQCGSFDKLREQFVR